jgi:serine/threonine protein kinase
VLLLVAACPALHHICVPKVINRPLKLALCSCCRYSIKEVIGKGSYGVVCSAIDNFTGEKVAIKKINNVFEHVSDATRILREIKLLRLLKHPGVQLCWGMGAAAAGQLGRLFGRQQAAPPNTLP